MVTHSCINIYYNTECHHTPSLGYLPNSNMRSTWHPSQISVDTIDLIASQNPLFYFPLLSSIVVILCGKLQSGEKNLIKQPNYSSSC